jgi:hypothetical protein
MGYFATLRTKESHFYQSLWDELAEIKVIDTHEHFNLMKYWKNQQALEKNNHNTIPQILDRSYVHIKHGGSYVEWAEELRQHRGTGYLRAWQITLEDLYGIEAAQITPAYLQKMETAINTAYADDIEHNTTQHIQEVLTKRMHVEKAILNIALGDHCELPQPTCQAAAGIPDLLEGIKVPKDDAPGIANPAYLYARDNLKMNLSDIRTLDDYCEVVEKFLQSLKSGGNYVCVKMQHAYRRPLWHPEPDEDDTKIKKMFNKSPRNEEDLWLFGDYMMHFILEWTSLNWRVPYQIHTGLARMYDGGSNALNLSHLFLKFQDMHFDLFHGNYPYNNLGGMLHQIPNISADLCWLPAISPTAAQRTLTELFEVGDMVSTHECHIPSMRTCLFGGDSGIVEGSYGALQLAKDVLIRSLEDLFNRGHILRTDAIDLAERVLYSNPKRIFKL